MIHSGAELGRNLADVRARIRAAADRAGRDPGGVLLVAVLGWEVRVASRNPSMFWIDPTAGQPAPVAVVYSRDATGVSAPAPSQSLKPPVERTRP